MSRVLILQADRSARALLETRASVHHETRAVETLPLAMRMITSFRPDVLLAGLEIRKVEALELLRYLQRNRIDIPTVIVAMPGAAIMHSTAMKLGAVAFIEYPVEQTTLDQTLSKVLQTDRDAHGGVPPISVEEQQANLTDLENQLNRHMVCFAGKNQVYIQSTIVGWGRTSKPRIALKCSLRKEYGHPPDVYYEYVRDVCCGDPAVCPAYQEFKIRNP